MKCEQDVQHVRKVAHIQPTNQGRNQLMLSGFGKIKL